jgi:hypothetical protein
MSIYDRDHNLGVDQSGLVCESNHPKLWSGVRATKGIKVSGMFYLKIELFLKF